MFLYIFSIVGEIKPVCHYKILRDCVGKYSGMLNNKLN